MNFKFIVRRCVKHQSKNIHASGGHSVISQDTSKEVVALQPCSAYGSVTVKERNLPSGVSGLSHTFMEDYEDMIECGQESTYEEVDL